AVAPHELSFSIGIERVEHARFLSGEDDVASGRPPGQHRRCTEVEIRSGLFAAVHVARHTPEYVSLAWGHLLRPAQRTAFEIKGKNGVRGFLRRTAVGIADRNV